VTGPARFDAVVLAGSRPGGDPLARHAGVSDKALLVIGGQTMLARVIAALRAAGAANVHVIASSDAVRDHALALRAIPLPAAPGPSASARAGLAAAGAPLLLTTADHALLRPEWIRAFLDAMPACDVAALLARRPAVERDAPSTRRTWLRFADGDWSGCNLFWLGTPAADAALAMWQAVEADRKRPWRIVRRLGPGLLLRYLAGRLALGQAVAALGARAGVDARVVESPFGLAAVDVDKPADLEFVRAMMERV